MTQLRIAVISDIHAEDTGGKWTHVLSEPPEPPKGRHPLRDLSDLIHDADIATDYLVVPGDVANQADAGGLSYAWRRLQGIANQLGARLIAVPGNHDVITHSYAEDRRGMLKSLLPSFPTGDPGTDDQFWRDGWIVLDRPDHRFLLLDSTIGFPDFPRDADEDSEEWVTYLSSIDRGALNEQIEMSIENYLARNTEAKVNIAIIHHHPQEHQLRSYLQDDYGSMYRGSDLIDILSRNPASGRWIIIHGHKHVPQLVNSVSTTSNGPLILCAGSLGARLWHPVNSVTRNQFHVLTASDEFLDGVSSLCGKVNTYTWGYGDGWNDSERRGSGLPANSGFGCSEDFRSISQRIVGMMNQDSLQFIGYEELERSHPQLPYMLPIDLQYLEDDLERSGFRFDRDRRDKLTQLSRIRGSNG